MDSIKLYRLKKVLETVITISIALLGTFVNKDFTVQYPGYPITMLFLIVSFISLCCLNKETNKELKITSEFLLIQTVANILIPCLRKQTFDYKTIIVNFLITVTLLFMYSLFKKPFFELYALVGKRAIYIHSVIVFVMLILVLIHINIYLSIFISIILWAILVKIVWPKKTT